MHGADVGVEGGFGGMRLTNDNLTASYSPYQSPTKTFAALEIFMYGFKAKQGATQTVRFIEGPEKNFVGDIEVPAALDKEAALIHACGVLYLESMKYKRAWGIRGMNWFCRPDAIRVYPTEKHNPTNTFLEAHLAENMEKSEVLSAFAFL